MLKSTKKNILWIIINLIIAIYLTYIRNPYCVPFYSLSMAAFLNIFIKNKMIRFLIFLPIAIGLGVLFYLKLSTTDLYNLKLVP